MSLAQAVDVEQGGGEARGEGGCELLFVGGFRCPRTPRGELSRSTTSCVWSKSALLAVVEGRWRPSRSDCGHPVWGSRGQQGKMKRRFSERDRPRGRFKKKEREGVRFGVATKQAGL